MGTRVRQNEDKPGTVDKFVWHIAWAAATGAHSVTERSYPTSEVRGCGGEALPCVEGQGGSQECQAATVQEQPPHFRGQGGSREELSLPEVRGGSREELPHVQGAVAVRAQEGLEELLHVQGQEGRW